MNNAAPNYADRQAEFVVRVNNELFVVRLVRRDQIVIARSRIAGSQKQGVLSGKLAEGDGGFNRDPKAGKVWSWHLVPETVHFPQLAMEVCDGRPSDVERRREHWINEIKMYCPWSTEFVSEICPDR